MDDLRSTRLRDFKDRIGFDGVAKPRAATVGVVARWPDPRTSPALKGEAWTIANETTWPAKDGVARKWFLRSDAQTIMITVFVSSTGTDPARQFFLATASETMTISVPYQKSDMPLGSLCVICRSPHGEDRIWFFENVCFQVRGIDTRADLAGLSKWLQKFAEANVVDDVSRHVPPLEKLEVSSREVKVGETVSLKVTLHDFSKAEGYRLEINQDGDRLRIDSDETLMAELTGQTAGRVGVNVLVIDQATLLSTSAVVEIRIRED